MLSRKNSLLVVAFAAVAVLVGMSGVAQATLVSYWAFDEAASATTASDTSGVNANNLTAYNSGSSAVTPTSGNQGVIGKCWQTYGTTTTVSGFQIATATGLNGLPALTMGLWVWESPNAPGSTGGGAGPNLMRSKNAATTDVYSLQMQNPNGTVLCNYPMVGKIANGLNQVTGVGSYSAFPQYYVVPGGWTNQTFTWYPLTSTTGYAVLYRNGVAATTNAAYNKGVMLTGNGGFWISGVQNNVNYSVTGYVDDACVWNEALSGPKVGAMYFAPTTFTTDATAGYYGQGDMQKLYNTYDLTAHPTTLINGLTWEYIASGLPGTVNTATQVGTLGSGARYILLNGTTGAGLQTQIPEPGTLALLACGLLGLLCYAWRKMNRHVLWTTAFAAVAVGFMVASARAEVISPIGQTVTAKSSYTNSAVSKLLTEATTPLPTNGCWNKVNPSDITTWRWVIGDWNGWMTAAKDETGRYFLFNLGASYNVGYVDLWNGWQTNSGGAARGVKNFKVWASDSSGSQITQLADITEPVEINDNGTTKPTMPCRRNSITPATTQWIKLELLSYQSNGIIPDTLVTGTGAGYMSVSAVRFETADIPEPSTLALLAAGLLGLLCYAWRKRK